MVTQRREYILLGVYSRALVCLNLLKSRCQVDWYLSIEAAFYPKEIGQILSIVFSQIYFISYSINGERQTD